MVELRNFIMKYRIQFLFCFVIILSMKRTVKSSEIIIDKLEDIRIPVISGCGLDSGYAVFSNFTCLDSNSPAIPTQDQDEYNSQGFFSGCNASLGRKCDFQFYRRNSSFVASISILGYFIGDSYININISPGNGNLTFVGERWTDNTLDLMILDDYEHIEKITITPVYLAPENFVIIDKVVLEMQEPSTGTPTSTTYITPTTIKTSTTPVTSSTTTFTTISTTSTTVPSTTSSTAVPSTITSTTVLPATRTSTAGSSSTIIIVPSTDRPNTENPTTDPTNTETATETEEAVSTTEFDKGSANPFWRLSNPIIILVFIVLPVVALILVAIWIIYSVRKKRIKDKNKNEDYFKEPVYIFRQQPGKSPATAGTFNGNSALPDSNYAASLEPIYSEASQSSVYGYGLGQKYLPRLTKRVHEQ